MYLSLTVNPLPSRQAQHGFILSRGQIERNRKTYIEFWLSTDDGPKKLVTAAQQSILFVCQADVETARVLIDRAGFSAVVKSLSMKTFQQQPVSGLYFVSATEFYRARDQLRTAGIICYEDDIRLSERYLMERYIYGSASFVSDETIGLVSQNAKLKPSKYSPSFSVLSLDIECSEKGELYSVGLALSKNLHNSELVIMIGNRDHDPDTSCSYLQWVENETDLLLALNDTIKSMDPDIVVGWNVINFDFKILVERAEVCKIKLNFSRDDSDVTWRPGRNDSNQSFVRIAGRVVIDGIDALKTATYQFDSFSLESVSQSLLGKGKKTNQVDSRMAEINHDFIHNKVKLARYNIQDCHLVLEIFAATNLFDYLILRSQITGLELDRMGGSVAAFINLYLPKLHRAGYVSPIRPSNGGLASPGGYVMNSFPGLYKNVLVLDFKSLYPSIIRTFKIDPMGLIEGLEHPENAIPGFRQAMFSRDKHFLPEIITALWAQRDDAKRNKDAARSQAIKILMNSFYGVLGSGGCPFYDTRLASSITLRGHEIMQTTAKWIEEEGYKVIYGDTDSTFVWIEQDLSSKEVQVIGQHLESLINSKWQEKLTSEFDLECHLEIEFETLFETFLMPTIRGSEQGSKKRYAGLKYVEGKTPELIFKGLETVRSDWTDLAKTFQRRLYELVFARQDVKPFLIDTITAINEGEHDDRLVYRKRLRQKLDQYTKNVPPHVKAARLADQQNELKGKPLQYQNKGWINYVITLAGPQTIEYKIDRLDYEHYIEKQIKPIAEGILPFIDLSFEDITSAQIGLF